MKLRYAFPIAVLAGSAFLAGAGLLGGCSGDVGRFVQEDDAVVG